jgi:eukaryotic-like serine/threonine-protein kinase
MSNLAFALRGLGRYAESRKVAQEAVSLGVATTPTRRLLYQLAVLAGDGSESQQLEWAKDRPREFDLISARAQVAAFEGRLRDASELYTLAADKARGRGLNGTASSFAAHLGWTEALYVGRAHARERVRSILGGSLAGGDGLEAVPRFRSAAALGYVGLTTEARAILAQAQARYPESTVVRTVLIPVVTASVALERERPADALQALEAAVPTERGSISGLIPMFLRGEAYLAAGDREAARREFQKVLDARGADPFAPVVPLAHLGLARAWAVDGDVGKAKGAYEELFRIWSRADADLPVLRRARAEYDRLQAGHPTASR